MVSAYAHTQQMRCVSNIFFYSTRITNKKTMTSCSCQISLYVKSCVKAINSSITFVLIYLQSIHYIHIYQMVRERKRDWFGVYIILNVIIIFCSVTSFFFFSFLLKCQYFCLLFKQHLKTKTLDVICCFVFVIKAKSKQSFWSVK